MSKVALPYNVRYIVTMENKEHCWRCGALAGRCDPTVCGGDYLRDDPAPPFHRIARSQGGYWECSLCDWTAPAELGLLDAGSDHELFAERQPHPCPTCGKPTAPLDWESPGFWYHVDGSGLFCERR